MVSMFDRANYDAIARSVRLNHLSWVHLDDSGVCNVDLELCEEKCVDAIVVHSDYATAFQRSRMILERSEAPMFFAYIAHNTRLFFEWLDEVTSNGWDAFEHDPYGQWQRLRMSSVPSLGEPFWIKLIKRIEPRVAAA